MTRAIGWNDIREMLSAIVAIGPDVEDDQVAQRAVAEEPAWFRVVGGMPVVGWLASAVCYRPAVVRARAGGFVLDGEGLAAAMNDTAAASGGAATIAHHEVAPGMVVRRYRFPNGDAYCFERAPALRLAGFPAPVVADQWRYMEVAPVFPDAPPLKVLQGGDGPPDNGCLAPAGHGHDDDEEDGPPDDAPDPDPAILALMRDDPEGSIADALGCNPDEVFAPSPGIAEENAAREANEAAQAADRRRMLEQLRGTRLRPDEIMARARLTTGDLAAACCVLLDGADPREAGIPPCQEFRMPDPGTQAPLARRSPPGCGACGHPQGPHYPDAKPVDRTEPEDGARPGAPGTRNEAPAERGGPAAPAPRPADPASVDRTAARAAAGSDEGEPRGSARAAPPEPPTTCAHNGPCAHQGVMTGPEVYLPKPAAATNAAAPSVGTDGPAPTGAPDASCVPPVSAPAGASCSTPAATTPAPSASSSPAAPATTPAEVGHGRLRDAPAPEWERDEPEPEGHEVPTVAAPSGNRLPGVTATASHCDACGHNTIELPHAGEKSTKPGPCPSCGAPDALRVWETAADREPAADWRALLKRHGKDAAHVGVPVHCKVCAKPIGSGEAVRYMPRLPARRAHKECVWGPPVKLAETDPLFEPEPDPPLPPAPTPLDVGSPIAATDPRDPCEWNPEANKAATIGDPWHNPAALLVGTGKGAMRLCRACSELPAHQRKRARKPLAKGAA